MFAYRIETSLSKEEIEQRIRSKSALAGRQSLFHIKEHLFIAVKIKEGKFSFYPSPLHIPPRGGRNSFIPKIGGEIIENSSGQRIVCIHVKIGVVNIFDGVWVLLAFIILLSTQNILVSLAILCLVIFLLVKYWNFVCKRVGKLLEELLA